VSGVAVILLRLRRAYFFMEGLKIKNFIKRFRIQSALCAVALAAVTGFSMAACDGGLSGTYMAANSTADAGLTVAFSGANLTYHLRIPFIGLDEDILRCNYSVAGDKVIAGDLLWVNSAYAGYADYSDKGTTLFTIVNASTLRDTDGGVWNKR
jgi:hypothetical protein